MVARLLGVLTMLVVALLMCDRAAAQTTAIPEWQLNGWQRGGSTLDLDFGHDRYWLNGTSYSGVANFITGAGATFSRASTATYFDSTGTMQTAAANVPRVDYGVGGGSNPLGILIEESRTNYIPNSTMVGAVIGTPGIVPLWGALGTQTGVSVSIVGKGTEFGMPYVDIKVSGTDTSGSTNYIGPVIPNNIVSTSPSVSWTGSIYARVVSGTLPYEFHLYIFEYDSSQSYLISAGAVASVATLSTTIPQRLVVTDTVSPNTAYLAICPKVVVLANATVNVTIRLYAPQLELGAFPTSVIPTSGSTVTRQGDAFTVPTSAGGGWSTAGQGTILANALTNYQKPSSSSHVSGILAFTDGTSNNNINVILGGTPAYDPIDLRFELFLGGTNSGGCNSSSFSLGIPMKEVVAFQANSIRGSINGGACSLYTSLTFPTFTTLILGAARFGNGGDNLDGWLNRVTYFPTRQPDAALASYSR